MTKNAHMSTSTLIRLDDIAENMNWQIMNRCESLFRKYNIKPVLGVIPNNSDPELLKLPEEKNFWKKIKNWQDQGWEISMHGYSHNYHIDTKMNDFFRLGGKSEFYGKSLEDQKEKIKKGLEIFKKNNIKIRSFFAPNHTYDLNTFEALKQCGLYEVIDGYGIKPYNENGIIFIPQLFYRLLTIPFFHQTTQIHINEWSFNEIDKFEEFIKKNKDKIISYEEMLGKKTNNLIIKLLNKLTKIFLISYRKFF